MIFMVSDTGVIVKLESDEEESIFTFMETFGWKRVTREVYEKAKAKIEAEEGLLGDDF